MGAAPPPSGAPLVARHLEPLRLSVKMPPRNPPWTEEELILALDLYLRSSSSFLHVAHPDVIELSRVLNALTIHPERPDAVRFRNPNGVTLKLANFAAIDPNYPGQGMTRGGKRDAEVWNQYASDEDALAEAAAAIREGREPQAVRFAGPTRPHVTEVEAQHVEQFQVSVAGQAREAYRREQSLVLAYRDHLESQGHKITRHTYPLHGSGPTLVCDLVDESDQVLYEAKGDVRRGSVRMAIGQLFDYRRFEPSSMSLAILLPREPTRDLIELIHSTLASAVWRTRDGFASSQPQATNFEKRAVKGSCGDS